MGQLPPDAELLPVLTLFGLTLQALVLDTQQGSTLRTAEIDGLSAGSCVVNRPRGDALHTVRPRYTLSDLNGLSDRRRRDAAIPIIQCAIEPTSNSDSTLSALTC